MADDQLTSWLQLHRDLAFRWDRLGEDAPAWRALVDYYGNAPVVVRGQGVDPCPVIPPVPGQPYTWPGYEGRTEWAANGRPTSYVVWRGPVNVGWAMSIGNHELGHCVDYCHCLQTGQLWSDDPENTRLLALYPANMPNRRESWAVWVQQYLDPAVRPNVPKPIADRLNYLTH